MELLMLIGRILFAAFFIISGIGHFVRRDMMASFMKSPGTPALLQRTAMMVVLGTGVMLLAGGLMVAAGVYADLGALLLVAFLVPTTLLAHGFWKLTDPAQRQQQQMAFIRNVTFFGGALLLFALFATRGQDVGFTLTDPIWKF